jgi:hypothetical protein
VDAGSITYINPMTAALVLRCLQGGRAPFVGLGKTSSCGHEFQGIRATLMLHGPSFLLYADT